MKVAYTQYHKNRQQKNINKLRYRYVTVTLRITLQ